MPISMYSESISVTDYTYAPVLATTGAMDVTASASYPSELTSGVITIGSDIVDALVKTAGGVYAEQQVVYINGSAVASQDVIAAPSWTENEDSLFRSFTLQVRGENYSYLDHVNTDSGVSCWIEHRLRYATTGETTSFRMFTGTIRWAQTEWSDTNPPVTSLYVEDLNGKWDHHELTVNITMDALPYGVVVFNVADECDAVALDTTNTITIKAGDVLIDRSGIGSFGSSGYSDFGGAYGSSQSAYGTSNSSSRRYGGIARVSIPETTLNLSNIPTITLTDETNLGEKTIFVSSAGQLTATDGGTPPDGVPLWAFDLQYKDQPITEDRLIDLRTLTIPAEDRTRYRVLELVLAREGYDTSDLSFPAINDDQVSTPLHLVRKPLLQWAKEWLEPSLARFYVDREGKPTVGLLRLDRDATGWAYDRNSCITARVSGAGRKSATADVTIRGMLRVNHGLTQRQETEVIEDRRMSDDAASTGQMGGGIKIFGETDETLQLVMRKTITKTFLGNSIVLEEEEVETKRNPLDIRSYQPPDDSNVGTEYYLGNAAFGNTGEPGIYTMYSEPKLQLDRVARTQHVYKSRIYRGWEKTEKKRRNPIYHHNDYGGVPAAGSEPPYGFRYYNFDGIARDGWIQPNYGWKYLEEQLETTAITRHEITPTINGFIESEQDTEWAMENPHKEQQYASDGTGEAATLDISTPSYGLEGSMWATGYHFQTDQLIKISETSTTYKRRNSEEIEIRRDTSRFMQRESAGSSHSGMMAGAGHGGTRGNTQGMVSSSTNDVEVKKGTLPVVTALEDDIDRTPVGWRSYSSTIATALDIAENVVNEQREYVETVEQCQRLSTQILGRSIALEWQLTTALNPALRVGDTIAFAWDTEGGRTYTAKAIVVQLGMKPALGPGTVASMDITARVDYNDVKVTLATRT